LTTTEEPAGDVGQQERAAAVAASPGQLAALTH
jgi:hypothetical protein